jgi:hypothetical protein
VIRYHNPPPCSFAVGLRSRLYNDQAVGEPRCLLRKSEITPLAASDFAEQISGVKIPAALA